MQFTLFKKISCIVAVMIGLVLINTSVYALENINFKYNSDSQMLNISGTVTLTDNECNDVSVQVIKPGYEFLDLSSATLQNIIDVLQYADQVTPDSAGNFSFNYKVKDTVNGLHKLRLIFADGSELYTNSFIYVDPNAALNIKNRMNNASDYNSIKEIILNYDYIFSEFKLYNELTGNDTERMFLNDVAARMFTYIPYSDIDKVIATFKKEVVMQVIKNSILASDTDKLFAKYFEDLGMTGGFYTEVYSGKLKQDKRYIICEDIHNKAFKNADGMISFIYENSVVYAINDVSNWSEVYSILNADRGFLKGFNFTDYDNLSNAQKSIVDKNVSDGKYDNLLMLKSAFNLAVEKAQQPDYVNRPHGGGGSGGGSSGGRIDIFPEQPPVPTNQNTSSKATFADISDMTWAVQSINELFKKGVVSGKSEAMFYPNDLVTREEFIKMLTIALDCVDEDATSAFSQIKKEDWFYKYIASAEKHKITDGLGNGLFGVGMNIIREDIATMAYRAVSAKYNVQLSTDGEKFSDDESISPYAKEAVYGMRNLNIINGKGGNKFAPKDYATRAEAAKIIYGVLQMTREDK